ncbi:cytochrome c peroxidase [Paludisphaera sp.]|uniref:cytochrome-c peroxidase n=1 Tax=Paludisphaera sp. TaxID=2017432 RepID=UPI00301CEA2E
MIALVAAASVRAQAPVGPTPAESEDSRRARAAELRAIYWKSSGEWPAPWVDEGVDWRELGRLPAAPAPADNPTTPEKVELGKKLFFDPRLSGSGQLSCASCHDPDLGWADGRTTAFGHRREPLRRNSPTIMNLAHMPAIFWDGRAGSLEDQAREVILNPSEMSATPDSVVRELSAVPEYRDSFRAVFGSEDVDLDMIAKAVAAFERSIVGGRSAFDKFLGGDRDAMSDEAILGLDLFRRKARCMNCHHGPAFSDGQFHDLGLSYYGRELEDLGRYRVTALPEDVGRFRTPGLRNVAATGPYMHNGLFELTGVLNMYNAGMATLKRKPEQADDPLFPTKSPHLKPLGLDKRELADLKAFLESLTEPKRRVRAPALPGLTAHPAPTPTDPAPEGRIR